MRRFFKIALLAAAAFLALASVSFWIVVDRFVASPRLKPRIESAASDFLGRPLTIDSLQWRSWPSAVLVGRGVRLYEDPGKSRVLVDAPLVEARVALLSVFKLAAGIAELRFVSPRVDLRRGKDGVWNAVRLADEIAARPGKPGRSWGTLAFNWFDVEGATVTVADEAGGWAELSPLHLDGRGKLRFGRRHLHFPFQLTGRLENGAAVLKVSGDLGGHSILAIDVDGAAPSLARPVWPAAAAWTGLWSASVKYDARPPARLEYRLRAAPLAVSTAASSLQSLEVSGEDLLPSSATFSFSARRPGTEISAKGSLNGNGLTVNATSPKADLGDLVAFVRAAGLPAPSSGAKSSGERPLRLDARVAVDDLRCGPIELTGLRGVVARSTGPYVLDSLSFSALGGSVTARGSYLPQGGDKALSLSWSAAGLDVAELFRLAGSTHAAAGVADSTGRLQTGVGGRFLPAMSGAAAADLRNGWFGGLPSLLKILARLNLTTLFAEAAGRHRQRIPFDETRGSVTIAGGRIRADKPVVLENKTLQMAFMGTYDLPTRTLDGRVIVNFLGVTNEIIGLIPGVRDILLGKEKGLIPIWLSVKGKASDPDVDILPAKTITAPFWNATRRVLRLPKTLFQKLKL